MLTKLQWTTIGFLVGLPLAMFVLLTFISPGYMAAFFLPNDFIDGIQVLIFLSGGNFLILYLGMRLKNRRAEKSKSNETGGFRYRDLAVLISLFLLFTVPALWVVFFYPAMIQIIQEGIPK